MHLLLQLQASDSVAEAVRMLKGGTSRIIRKEFPELEEFLWGDSFWADGYFAESVGHVNEEVIKKYIDEQRKITRLCRRFETPGFSPGSIHSKLTGFCFGTKIFAVRYGLRLAFG